ncbi:MAG: hypothetical protein JNM48_02165 [Rhodospirillales bacterium]|nr:hypothetical protein [Rhodospirillales bacterium]
MPETSRKIMLVSDDDNSAVRVQHAIQAVLDGAVVTTQRPDASLDHPAEVAYDLLLVDVDSNWMETIVRLRQQQPDAPLIAICDSSRKAIEALQAEAQGRLGSPEREGPVVACALRDAIRCGRFQLSSSETGEQLSQDREIARLGALGSPVPLPSTERSFGAMPLSHAEALGFASLVERYGALLDQTPVNASAKDQSVFVSSLIDIADHLGALEAGPRDAVDLHKAAMASRLKGRTPSENRVYVEEGRLLLVQLMGYLVSYYRRLSWGSRSGGSSPTTPFRADRQPQGRGP